MIIKRTTSIEKLYKQCVYCMKMVIMFFHKKNRRLFHEGFLYRNNTTKRQLGNVLRTVMSKILAMALLTAFNMWQKGRGGRLPQYKKIARK
jgi:hypothetical protein